MRVFLRLVNGKRITLWLPFDATFFSLQILLDQSNQSVIPSDALEFVSGSRRVTQSDARLSSYSHIDDSSRVHLFVRPKLPAVVKENYCLYHTPTRGATNCAVCNLKLCMIFQSTVYQLIKQYLQVFVFDLSIFLCVRDEKDDLVGIAQFTVDDSISALYVELDDILGSLAMYTVYLDLSVFPIQEINNQMLSDEHLALEPSPHLTDQAAYGYYEWSFTTGKLPTIRLLTTLSNTTPGDEMGDSNRQKLIVLTRQTAAMLEEIKQQIAAAFSIPSHSIGSVHVQNLYGDSVVLSTNQQVAGLSEMDSLLVYWDAHLSVCKDIAIPITVAKPFTAQDWQKYNEENWVNEASGYLAVCGKMSAEEEEQLLLQVVQAFAHSKEEKQQDTIGGSNGWVVTSAHAEIVISDYAVCMDITGDAIIGNHITATSTLTADLLSQDQSRIPLSMRESYWRHPTIPPVSIPLQNLQQTVDHQRAMVDMLKKRGYMMLELDEETSNLVRRAFAACQKFFAQSMLVKEKCRSSYHYYLGYRDVPAFAKEFFQLRRFNASEQVDNTDQTLWSGFPAEAKHALDTYYCQMHAISSLLVWIILRQFGFDEGYIQSLMEPSGNDSSFEYSVSRCNVSAFHYMHPEQQIKSACNNLLNIFTHCPHHSDLTFVTIIPIAMGAAGLHVYDWAAEQWLDTEIHATSGQFAVVFCGELMSYLTNSYLMPGMHEVSRVIDASNPYNASDHNTDRYSLPFQCCGRNDAVLDPVQCKQLPSNAQHSAQGSSAMSLGQFMDSMTRGRVSSNYLKPG
ncbi:isopenicillin N synthase family oxygenase [archaeon]|nr:MAG: isopenicillin N synthase family oxygenase [archaeon]